MWWRKQRQNALERAATAPLPVGEAERARVQVRSSEALRYFREAIGGEPRLTVIDLGPVSQANIDVLAATGHRVYVHDFLRTLDESTPAGGPAGGPTEPERIAEILQATLQFPPRSVRGVLAWDILQFLSAPLLHALIQRLAEAMHPGAPLLAYFDSAGRLRPVTCYTYRIHGTSSLEMVPRGERVLVSVFSTREIERLFQGFQSVKFFITRGQAREVIVTR